MVPLLCILSDDAFYFIVSCEISVRYIWCYLHFRYLNASNFFVSELNYQVLVCIFLVRTFWYQDYFDSLKLFVFVSPAFHMLSIERRRHDVHVLFGDVSFDVRNAHWHVKNKIKRKFTLFQ